MKPSFLHTRTSLSVEDPTLLRAHGGRSRSGWWILSPWTIAVGLLVMLGVGIGVGVGVGAGVWNQKDAPYPGRADWYAVSPPFAAEPNGQRLLYHVYANWTRISIYYALYDSFEAASALTPKQALDVSSPATASSCWNPVGFLQNVRMTAYPLSPGMWQLVSAPQDLQSFHLLPGPNGGAVVNCPDGSRRLETTAQTGCTPHIDPATGNQAQATGVGFSTPTAALAGVLASHFQSPFHSYDEATGLCTTELAPFFYLANGHEKVVDGGSDYFMSLPYPEGANRVVATTPAFHLTMCPTAGTAAEFRPGAPGARPIVARDIWPVA
jgi:hypothetical protein